MINASRESIVMIKLDIKKGNEVKETFVVPIKREDDKNAIGGFNAILEWGKSNSGKQKSVVPALK